MDTKHLSLLIINYLVHAEEGTRTPTPLRAHGPEPCASANSATSARSTPWLAFLIVADALERCQTAE
jgi:hypothetical protein